MEFDFTLKFRLPGTDYDSDEMVGKLMAAGCDDALIGIGVPGRLALNFIREAVSADEAMLSALADVKKAIPAASLIEALPDLVGLTDVADLLGVSRQYIRKVQMTHSATFPAAVHEGNPSLWHLAHLLDWFKGKGLYEHACKTSFEISRVAMEINITKETKYLAEIKRSTRSDTKLEKLVA
jgi:hypothetical protein